MTIHRISPKLQTIYDHQFPDDGVTVTLSEDMLTLTGVRGDVTKTVTVPPSVHPAMGRIVSLLPQLHQEFHS